jgi:hypothetical protein
MTTKNLVDLMAESTRWTQSEPVHPAADIARGRARLRRHRIGIGGVAAAGVSVAVLATGTAIGGSGSESLPAAAPTTSTTATADCAGRDWEADAQRLMKAFGGHADPAGRYLSPPPHGFNNGCAIGTVPGPWLDVSGRWRQDGAVDRVRVQVHPPGDYADPQLGEAYLHPHKQPCKLPPWPAFTPYSCSERTVDGKRVVVGVSTARGYRSYLVGYVRPDGQLVTVRVESGVHGDPQTEQPENPVRTPDVTVEQLVAAATDPAMTLR